MGRAAYKNLSLSPVGSRKHSGLHALLRFRIPIYLPFMKRMLLLTASCVVLLLTSCRSKRLHGFVVTKHTKDLELIPIKPPYIIFALQNEDTLKFSLHQTQAYLDSIVRKDINRWGYSSIKHIQRLAEEIRKRQTDTVVLENLSAVDRESLSGSMTNFIARELLVQGRAEVTLKSGERPARLLYTVYKDQLGGISADFKTEKGYTVYKTIIAFGE